MFELEQLLEGDGVAAWVLKKLGVQVAEARQAILKESAGSKERGGHA